MLLWDNNKHNKILIEEIIRAFNSKGIKFHKIKDIIPDIDIKFNQYTLSPFDDHPNAHTHKIISNYII